MKKLNLLILITIFTLHGCASTPRTVNNPSKVGWHVNNTKETLKTIKNKGFILGKVLDGTIKPSSIFR